LAIATAEMTILRWLDIVVLVLALPVFIALDAPLAGYAVCGGAWLIGRAGHLAAERHAETALAEGNRRRALGTMAVATLGRVWFVVLAVLIVGLSDEDAGLAAALLAAAVVTAYFVGLGLQRLFEPEGSGT
jgi:hypothetical protein